MTTLTLSNAPIYDDNGALNLPYLVDSYGLTRKEFAEISGVSVSTLSRSGPPSPHTKSRVVELVGIYVLLWKISKGNEEQIKSWLDEPKAEYWGLSPIQFMKIDNENISTVFKNIREMEYGEAMGT
ncbi:MAG: XRE family transcriptional regulator [Deltaproteobacteria bacterium]|nr:MAG: XRE family transcriptional regulator [Deltaproteobacteria bacterium]